MFSSRKSALSPPTPDNHGCQMLRTESVPELREVESSIERETFAIFTTSSERYRACDMTSQAINIVTWVGNKFQSVSSAIQSRPRLPSCPRRAPPNVKDGSTCGPFPDAPDLGISRIFPHQQRKSHSRTSQNPVATWDLLCHAMNRL